MLLFSYFLLKEIFIIKKYYLLNVKSKVKRLEKNFFLTIISTQKLFFNLKYMTDKSQRDEILEKDEQAQVIEEQEEVIEEEQEEIKDESKEITRLKELFARHQADCDNFKKRMERDKQDMIFFLKSDILVKILPRMDDLERMIANTPEDLQNNALFT
jgi:molecular chaperone GrpE (heat shock protein)